MKPETFSKKCGVDHRKLKKQDNKMNPFKVYLRSDKIDALKTLSKRRGTLMLEWVRMGMDRILEEKSFEENFLSGIISIFYSGLGDLSEKHDEFLAKTIREENQGCG
jgi:hypothetical protein